jgi:hypothetical protein
MLSRNALYRGRKRLTMTLSVVRLILGSRALPSVKNSSSRVVPKTGIPITRLTLGGRRRVEFEFGFES